MKFIRHFWSFFLVIFLVYTLDKPIGSIPPLGRLFSPFQGFLQNSESSGKQIDSQILIDGVKEEVKVIYDSNRVPHIFANNEDDLYFAQGYVIAKDRIWQMEFYTLVASGRLTEIVGEKALEYDKYNRRLGMAKASVEIEKKLKSDPISKRILDAYSKGVNAYIAQLDYKNLPIEYKILGYRPAEWSPYKTILMLMNMRNTLNGGSNDYRISNVVAKYGLETVQDLFPDYPTSESPIIPVGTSWDFTPVPVKTPDKIMADIGTDALRTSTASNDDCRS